MVVIKPGSFMMGSKVTEADSFDYESPQHKVTITYPFAIAKYEVTFAEYDRFALATGRTLPNDKGWGRKNRPVINVSFDDAIAYTRWLSAQTGKNYRLPSEAEWEYVARAGSQTAYWWGDKVGSNHAVCDGCGSQWDNKQTAPVGAFKANRFGVYDTAGNVWEWTQDCWHDSYNNAPNNGSAWLAANDGECNRRVVRGGSWEDYPQYLWSAKRIWYYTDVAFNFFGFRVARAL
ncbi:MAG: formylglycine-generating enzyme family protein [Methylococcaceae bacterium]|nr:formylglycine-generating enzyme family protein [Methylococcaceae bacterium]